MVMIYPASSLTVEDALESRQPLTYHMQLWHREHPQVSQERPEDTNLHRRLTHENVKLHVRRYWMIVLLESE